MAIELTIEQIEYLQKQITEEFEQLKKDLDSIRENIYIRPVIVQIKFLECLKYVIQSALSDTFNPNDPFLSDDSDAENIIVD